MTTATPRRRVLRPPPTTPVPPELDAQRTRLRSALALEQANVRRWLSRLKRAMNALQKHQAHVVRLERKLAQISRT